jgi:uncharacterized protein YfkK (UPF0435 family)
MESSKRRRLCRETTPLVPLSIIKLYSGEKAITEGWKLKELQYIDSITYNSIQCVQNGSDYNTIGRYNIKILDKNRSSLRCTAEIITSEIDEHVNVRYVHCSNPLCSNYFTWCPHVTAILLERLNDSSLIVNYQDYQSLVSKATPDDMRKMLLFVLSRDNLAPGYMQSITHELTHLIKLHPEEHQTPNDQQDAMITKENVAIPESNSHYLNLNALHAILHKKYLLCYKSVKECKEECQCMCHLHSESENCAFCVKKKTKIINF